MSIEKILVTKQGKKLYSFGNIFYQTNNQSTRGACNLTDRASASYPQGAKGPGIKSLRRQKLYNFFELL